MTMRIGPLGAIVALSFIVAWLAFMDQAVAQAKGEKTFNALITDTQGIDTEVKNVLFYWEEKISEVSVMFGSMNSVVVSAFVLVSGGMTSPGA